MKRLFVFILLALLLCGINLNITKNLNLKSIFGGAEVEVYLENNESLGNLKTIQNGKGQIVFCNIDDLNYILKKYKILGFTVFCEGRAESILKKLKPSYTVSTKLASYGFVNCNISSVKLNGKLVNFQYKEYNAGGVVFGFPILLGSY